MVNFGMVPKRSIFDDAGSVEIERERERVGSESILLSTVQELWKSQVVSWQDTMPESVSTNWKEPVYVKSQCGELECFTEYACTFMARDWKGAGNQRFNGVLECHEE